MTNCRICFSEDIETILNFGETALANAYLDSPNQEHATSPLEVFLCNTCGSVQLKETVDSKLLFNNYLYQSSTSQSFKNHFKEYAKSVSGRFKPRSIFEIGSNDGILLEQFALLGYDVTGMEPAKNLADIANAKGLKTINSFFSYNCMPARDCFDLVVANNVFAHIEDLHSVIEGIKQILTRDGVFVFENAYWRDTVENNYFDQVYCEHIYYHTLQPLTTLFVNHGMYLFDVERNNIQGGTIRCFVKKAGSNHMGSGLLDQLMDQEEFLYESDTYKKFNENLKDISRCLKSAMALFDNVYAYGCPAKFTTFCKVLDVNFDYVIDDAPMKQGKYTPGWPHTPIVPSSFLLERQPEACVITAWNFADAIMEANKGYKGKWIIPMPVVKII